MSEAPMTKVDARQRAGLKRWLPLPVLAALMALTFAFGWHKYLSFKTIGLNYEAMRSFIGENFFAALALYMLIYIAAVALSAPGGLIMTLSGGLLFGWQAGAPATAVKDPATAPARYRSLRAFVTNPNAIVGLLLLAVMIVAALLAPIIYPDDPTAMVARPLRWPGQAQQIVQLQFGDGVTNNEAEYDTLAAALEAVVKRLHDFKADPATARVGFRGDSQLVINQGLGEWKCREDRMRQRRDRVRALPGSEHLRRRGCGAAGGEQGLFDLGRSRRPQKRADIARILHASEQNRILSEVDRNRRGRQRRHCQQTARRIDQPEVAQQGIGQDNYDCIEAVFEYPGCIVNWEQRLSDTREGKGYGISFYGEQGTLYVDRGTIVVKPDSLGMKEYIGEPEKSWAHPPHHNDFFDCIRTRRRPQADSEQGVRSTAAPLLAGIALKTRRKLYWDSEAEHFLNDPQADQHLSRAYRAPWHI